MRESSMTISPGEASGSSVAVPSVSSSYPGGKSGAGIYQRLINLIPRHRILISAFAGHCGIVRNIRPAEQTIVIDPDEAACEWWASWSRTKQGRRLEVHHCDSIEWLRHRFGLTEYSACGSGDATRRDTGSPGQVARNGVAAGPHNPASSAETFIFCDPPYVLSERSHGKIYAHELCDDGHHRLLRILTQIPATSAAVMVCGYSSPIYASLEPWRSIDHRVPTRGGLQDERIWLNYPEPAILHDHRFVGNSRRERERIRRRQINWRSQLNAMGDRERAAMLEVLNRE